MKENSRSASLLNVNSKWISRKDLQTSRDFASGLRTRVDIHTGFWWCNSCVGETKGSELIKPKCDYCQID